MENNSSPYVYEKPLRAKRSIRNRSFAAVGLVAVGTAIGGGAFANSLFSDAGSESATSLNSSDQTNLASGTTAVDPIFVVPFEQAKPSKGSAAIELPALSNESYGNTSSATPYAGGGQTGSNIGVYQSRDRDDDDDDDRYESKREDHDDEQEDNEDD